MYKKKKKKKKKKKCTCLSSVFFKFSKSADRILKFLVLKAINDEVSFKRFFTKS